MVLLSPPFQSLYVGSPQDFSGTELPEGRDSGLSSSWDKTLIDFGGKFPVSLRKASSCLFFTGSKHLEQILLFGRVSHKKASLPPLGEITLVRNRWGSLSLPPVGLVRCPLTHFLSPDRPLLRFQIRFFNMTSSSSFAGGARDTSDGPLQSPF